MTKKTGIPGRNTEDMGRGKADSYRYCWILPAGLAYVSVLTADFTCFYHLKKPRIPSVGERLF